MKNNTLKRKHVRDERRRQRNQRKLQAQAQKPTQPVNEKRGGIVIALDFNQTRPVIRSKSNLRYGNPRPMEQAA